MIGLPGICGSENTIGMRVRSAAATNGPPAFCIAAMRLAATFCSPDLFSSFGMWGIPKLQG